MGNKPQLITNIEIPIARAHTIMRLVGLVKAYNVSLVSKNQEQGLVSQILKTLTPRAA